MYEFKPKRQNRIALIWIFALLALSAAAFVGSTQVPKYPIILQSVGLLLLLPAIQLLTRFVATRYLYRILPYESGEVDLEVYAYRGGKNMQLVCRVGLEEITAVTPLGEGNRKPAKGLHRYNYCMEMAPHKATVLSITNGDGDCEVILSPDETLLSILQGTPSAQ